MTEEWRPVVGWESLYEVSNLGRVRSLPRSGQTAFGVRSYGGKVLKHVGTRYALVNLSNKTGRVSALVHTLVLTAFVGPRPEGMQACHWNGDRKDARLSNLRWDTVTANAQDRVRHGTAPIGSSVHNARLTSDDVRMIRSMPIRDAVQHFSKRGISEGCVSKAKYRSTWRHVK